MPEAVLRRSHMRARFCEKQADGHGKRLRNDSQYKKQAQALAGQEAGTKGREAERQLEHAARAALMMMKVAFLPTRLQALIQERIIVAVEQALAEAAEYA